MTSIPVPNTNPVVQQEPGKAPEIVTNPPGGAPAPTIPAPAAPAPQQPADAPAAPPPAEVNVTVNPGS